MNATAEPEVTETEVTTTTKQVVEEPKEPAEQKPSDDDK